MTHSFCEETIYLPIDHFKLSDIGSIKISIEIFFSKKNLSKNFHRVKKEKKFEW